MKTDIDVMVEVRHRKVWFKFLSARARKLAHNDFDRWTVERDIAHAKNLINYIEAAGMSVTPSARQAVMRMAKRTKRPRRSSTASSIHRALKQMLREVVDFQMDLRLIRWISTTIISVLLMTRLWHAAEPLLISVREWWAA